MQMTAGKSASECKLSSVWLSITSISPFIMSLNCGPLGSFCDVFVATVTPCNINVSFSSQKKLYSCFSEIFQQMASWCICWVNFSTPKSSISLFCATFLFLSPTDKSWMFDKKRTFFKDWRKVLVCRKYHYSVKRYLLPLHSLFPPNPPILLNQI